jgi:hypothetical protein
MSEEQNTSPENANSRELKGDESILHEQPVDPVIQSETFTNQSSIENMEVHHHPDLHHRPKPWKEYFLEFLMIFLAVTMGFFAERIRESIAENNKEKQYVISMLEDLKADTANLNVGIGYWNYVITSIDSVNRSIKDETFEKNTNKFYKLVAKTNTFRRIKHNNRTVSELISSGNIRLIRNRKVSYSIMALENIITQVLKEQERAILEYTIAATNFEHELIDFSFFPYPESLPKSNQFQDAYSMSMLYEIAFSSLPSHPPLLSKDRKIVNQYSGMLRTREGIILTFLETVRDTKKIANSLIEEIKKNYELE